MKKPLIAAVGALTLAAGLGIASGPAQAHEQGRAPTPGSVTTLASHLVSPLSLSVDDHGRVNLTQDFASKLSRINSNGSVATRYSAPGWDVAGVSDLGRTTYFLRSQGAGPEDTRPLRGELKSISADGRVHTITDQFGAYETRVNPDRNVRYSFRDITNSTCLAALAKVPGPFSPYKGVVDSHPYASAATYGAVYVADAGANAVLKVDTRTGKISTVTVLPAVPLLVTQALAQQNGLPSCAVGHNYYLEGVPTDVEIGRDGWLYVSSLPGGPEGPGIAKGAVYKVNPDNGRTVRIMSGLAGATDVALDRHGDVFVTELFGNRISVLARGAERQRTFLNVTEPGAVEVRGDQLYASTNVLPTDQAHPTANPQGKVIRVELKWSH